MLAPQRITRRFRFGLGQALPEYVMASILLLMGAIAAYQALELETVMQTFIARSTTTQGQAEGGVIVSPGLGVSGD